MRELLLLITISIYMALPNMGVANNETDVFDTYQEKYEEVIQRQIDISTIKDKKEWFLAYKELISDYSEWFDPPLTVYDEFTDDEIYLMQRCIETETFQCDFESKCNVASVILNRVYHERFPDDIETVITSPNQFAYGRKIIEEDTVLALEYAYMIEDTTEGALFFHSGKKTNTFNGAEYIFTDTAGHHFYK